MKAAVALVVVLCVPCSALGLSCDEYFEENEGSLPSLMIPTCDPNDTGQLVVQGGVLAHTQPGPAHIVWLCESWFPPGGVWLEVYGAEWEFAWRITAHSASSGTCLRLSHDDRHGEWGYSLSKVSWECPDPSVCPDCQYMWHSGTEEWTVSHPTGGPVEGWQLVRITEFEPTPDIVRVAVDSIVIFEGSCGPCPEWLYTGLGCSGGEGGEPIFDNLSVWWPDPVEESTWGSVKALYR